MSANQVEEELVCIFLGLIDDLTTRRQRGTHTLYSSILQVSTEVQTPDAKQRTPAMNNPSYYLH
jgi:hypothetical protein